MKKSMVISCVMLLVFGVTGLSYALPIHATNEGKIEISGVTIEGYNNGDWITYEFLIDLDRPGEALYADGAIVYDEDSFYIRFIAELYFPLTFLLWYKT